MITEDYVSFEVAMLLKEYGFDEKCEMFFTKPKEGYKRNIKLREWKNSDLRSDMTCTCPTLNVAMKWLRETYNLHVDCRICKVSDPENKNKFVFIPGCFNVYNQQYVVCDKNYYIVPKNMDDIYLPYKDSYEDAVNAALKYALEVLCKKEEDKFEIYQHPFSKLFI